MRVKTVFAPPRANLDPNAELQASSHACIYALTGVRVHARRAAKKREMFLFRERCSIQYND